MLASFHYSFDQSPVILSQISPTQENHYLHTFHLSLSTFLVFIGWNSLGPMLTPIFGALGAMTLSARMIALALGSVVVAPCMIQYLGVRKCLIVGLFGYTLFPLSLLDPSGSLMILCGIAAGTGGSIFLNAQSLFASKASTHQTIGIHNGIFFTSLLGTNLVGNSLSYMVLAHYPLTYWLMIGSGLAAVGVLISLFLPTAEDSSGSAQLSTPPEDAPSALQTLQLIWQMVCSSRRLQLYTPAMMWQGLAFALWVTWFPTNVLAPCYGVSAIGIYMSSYGASNALGSLLAGIAVSRLSRRTVWLCGVMLTSVLGVAWCALLAGHCQPVAHYLIAALMGLEDASVNHVFGSAIATHFSQSLAQMSYAAGWWRLILGLTAFTVMLTAYHLPMTLVVTMTAMAALGSTALFIAAESVQ